MCSRPSARKTCLTTPITRTDVVNPPGTTFTPSMWTLRTAGFTGNVQGGQGQLQDPSAFGVGVLWGAGGANGVGQLSYAVNSNYTWSYYVNVVNITINSMAGVAAPDGPDRSASMVRRLGRHQPSLSRYCRANDLPDSWGRIAPDNVERGCDARWARPTWQLWCGPNNRQHQPGG